MSASTKSFIQSLFKLFFIYFFLFSFHDSIRQNNGKKKRERKRERQQKSKDFLSTLKEYQEDSGVEYHRGRLCICLHFTEDKRVIFISQWQQPKIKKQSSNKHFFPLILFCTGGIYGWLPHYCFRGSPPSVLGG